MTKYKNLILSVLFGVVLALLPILILFFSNGALPKVPIEVIDDTLYYLTRISEVTSGNIFIGNSYILEHVKDITTSFFVGDWIYTFPFWFFSTLFDSLNAALILSGLLWSGIISFLLFVFYKKISVREEIIPYAVFLSVFSTLFFVIRPVAMSVVYPVFILFLISLYAWLKNEEGKKERLFLVLSSVMGIYIYTYLGQLIIVVLGLLFLRAFFKKSLKRISIDILKIILISTPFFYYTFRQLNSEYYFDTLKRVGLLDTHLIGLSALIYTLVLLSVLFILYSLKRKEFISSNDYNFFSIVGAGLFITGLSNVISGKDLELAVHLGRFTDLFVTIFVFFIFSKFYKNAEKIGYVLIIPMLIVVLYNAYLIKDTFRILKVIPTIEYKDEYKVVIRELNNLPKNSVIFANDDISSYIPLTDQYVLFHPNAELYLASNSEIEERYLLSRAFGDLDISKVKSEYRKYAGVGNAVHEANILNKKAKICRGIKKIVEIECNSEFVDSYSLRGEKYFEELLDEYYEIKKNPNKYLIKYSVDYIIVDKTKDKWNIIGGTKKDLNDQFAIYKLN